MGFFRHLLPVAAAAAVGAALVYAAEKLVEKQEDENIVDPEAFDDFDLYDDEDNEDDTTATATVEPAAKADETDTADEADKAAAEPAADRAEAKPAAKTANDKVDSKGWERVREVADTLQTPAFVTTDDASTPNENPVRDEAEPTPTTEDGKIDVEKLASPKDFGNWDDAECKG